MDSKPIVIFILGGPGSGKGTQCELLHKNYHFHHLSAGDLLRAERQKQGSPNKLLIDKYILEGKIVPSQITIALLEQAMRELGWENGRFLIDGFPRNQENLNMWNSMMGDKVVTPFMIFLDCSEETMVKRCLKRGETSQRSDDNLEVLKKRYQTFINQTMEVVGLFKKQDKVVHVNSQISVNEVYTALQQAFAAKNIQQ